jgi:hypothetical protein
MPAVRNPRPSLRLLAVVAAGLVPALGLAALLLPPVSRDAAAARREQRGLEYLAAVKAFAKAALEHRRTAGDYIRGSADSVQVARRAEPVDAALRALEANDAQAGDGATRHAMGQLRDDWEAIGSNLAAWARAGNLDAFWSRSAGLLFHTRDLAEAVADAGGLSADPEPAAHGLQDVLVVLIRDADHLSKTSLEVRRAARAPRLQRATERQLQHLLAYVEDNSAALKRDHAAVHRAPGQFAPNLTALDPENAGRARSKLVRAVESNVLRDAAPVDQATAAAVMTLGEQGIGEDFELFDAAARELRFILADRVAARERTLVLAAGIGLAGLVLALMAASLVGRSLAQTSTAVAEGVEMARVAQVRQLAERVRDAAAQAAAAPGTRDLAGRMGTLAAAVRGIEPAARLLEEMADESSVAALNIELQSAAGGDVAVAPEVGQLADRSADTARRVIELARTAEREAVSLERGLREQSPADAGKLTSLVAELNSAIDELPV